MTPVHQLKTPMLASERIMKVAQDALSLKEAQTPLVGG